MYKPKKWLFEGGEGIKYFGIKSAKNIFQGIDEIRGAEKFFIAYPTPQFCNTFA